MLVSGKLLEFASNLYFGNNSNVITQLANLASVNTVSSNLSTHTNNRSNPHGVTAAQVGALSTTGGTINGNLLMTGNLTLKGSGNFGNQINFGDADYVHFLENVDDCLEIKAKKVNFVISDSSDTKFTINNTNPFGAGGVEISARTHSFSSNCQMSTNKSVRFAIVSICADSTYPSTSDLVGGTVMMAICSLYGTFKLMWTLRSSTESLSDAYISISSGGTSISGGYVTTEAVSSLGHKLDKYQCTAWLT